jgi:hypothetical protein
MRATPRKGPPSPGDRRSDGRNAMTPILYLRHSLSRISWGADSRPITNTNTGTGLDRLPLPDASKSLVAGLLAFWDLATDRKVSSSCVMPKVARIGR